MKLSHGILTVIGVVLGVSLYFSGLCKLCLYYYDKPEPVIRVVKMSQPMVKAPTILKILPERVPVENVAKPTYEDLRDVTVLVRGTKLTWNDDDQELLVNSWLGTGVIICETNEYTYILTNQHVAPKAMAGTYIFVENEVDTGLITAEVIANSTTVDLSLIRIKQKLYKKHEFYGIAKSLEIGDSLFMVGHHLGRPYLYGEGLFAGYDHEFGVAQMPTLYGNSGSGVFNIDKKLVGIIFAGSIYQIGFAPGFDVAHGLFVPIDKVREFLRENLNVYLN